VGRWVSRVSKVTVRINRASVRVIVLAVVQFCAHLKTVLFCRAYETLA